MRSWFREAALVLLCGSVAIAQPSGASAEPPVPSAGAVMYELTENLSLRSMQRGQRKATAELIGFAVKGTPLCPHALVDAVNPSADHCTINATGSDDISLSSGKGQFGGAFKIVVQDTNVVDGPEVIVGKGRFYGNMNFAPAILYGLPWGTVEGHVTVNGFARAPFTGTFRLPFVLGQGSEIPLYAANPSKFLSCIYSGVFGNDCGVTPVEANEHAVGYPTVRFEITF